MHCTYVDISRTSLKITKVSYLLCLLIPVDFLNYKSYNEFQIILEFQYSVVGSFINSKCYLWFVLALAASENKFIIAKLMMWVWYIMNE